VTGSENGERGALVSLALCMLLPSLGISIANVALPTLAGAFGGSFQHVQWVVLAYLLATTTSIVTVGRLGDTTGRRRLLIAGTILFGIASGLCGIAPTLWYLVAARAAQGLGAAVMLALAMAFVGEAVSKSRIGSAMGVLGTMSAVGTALGPSLGGILIARFGWRAIFLVNVPFSVFASMLAHRFLPADRKATGTVRTPFDAAGTLTLAWTLTTYALAMTMGRGRFGVANVALLAAAALGVGLFAVVEERAAAPMIRPAMLLEPALRASLAMSALVSTVMMATLVVGPFYLSRSLGLDTAVVGIVMSVGPVIAALSGMPAGRLVDRFGASRMSIGGLGGMATGCLALSLTAPSLGIVGYTIPTAIVTASYALFQAANNTAVMMDVARDQRGVVGGMLNLSRSLGLITGASVMGTVFALAAHADDVATAAPQSVAVGMRMTFAIASALIAAALAMAYGNLTAAPSASAAPSHS
jgi:MFS family permease